MCKNVLSTGDCKYGDKCQFAHGIQELVTSMKNTSNEQLNKVDKYKSQNCRMFHRELYCAFGSMCIFRHE